MLVTLKSDIPVKLNDGLDRFMKGSNWYPQKVMDILDVKEYTAGIKSGVDMEHFSGIVIQASGRTMGLSFLRCSLHFPVVIFLHQ